ncbi:MAG: MATE family efflux transporter [Clostridium sp.]|uniref:MATE family efflux transporter n=1 Tax=Clostridium sp. TaxID=1506 RepID=UPI003F384782
MKKLNLLEADIGSLIIKYMVPSVLGMMGTSLCIFLDTMFIGQGIGNDGLAALNIVLPVYSLFNSIGLLFGVGGATLLAISIGRRRHNDINVIFSTSMLMVIIIGIISSIIGVIFTEEICILLGASDSLLPLAVSYGRVLLSGSIVFMFINALNVFVRNDGEPKLSMWTVIITNIINVVLDYIFIFPLQMGMMGAALATTLGQFGGIAVLMSHFIRKRNNISFKIKEVSFKFIKRILKSGLPSFILEISAGVVIFMFNIKLSSISGDVAVSAYSIISNVALIFVAIFNGVSQGLQPILGVNYGARKLKRTYSIYKIGMMISGILGCLFLLIGIFAPNILVSIFSSSKDELLDITVNGIRIYFIAFVPMGLNILNIGFMQSIEMSKASITLSIVRGLVLIVLLVNILSALFGLNGVWMTIPVVEAITLIISTFIIRRMIKNWDYI